MIDCNNHTLQESIEFPDESYPIQTQNKPQQRHHSKENNM